MFRSFLVSVVLAGVVLCGSGCATILGGIIGHQSGELAAGLAIGAAIDFGDDIVRGIGQMTAGEKDLRRDFLEKSTFDANRGEITLPITPFNQPRTMEIAGQLQETFHAHGWETRRTKKSVSSGLFSPTRWEEKWAVRTDEGAVFELQIDFASDRDTFLRVRNLETWPHGWGQGEAGQGPPDLTIEQKMTITSRIYQWIEGIVLSKG